jgi:hypothetical protein
MVPLPITCPGSRNPVRVIELTGLVNLMDNAPEAVWPEVVELQEVSSKQASHPKPPLGPEAVNCAEPLDPEVVVELELEEQPPELPLTPV